MSAKSPAKRQKAAEGKVVEKKADTFEYVIACLGAGYVGGPTMAIIAHNCPNIKIIVCDINPQQIQKWNSDRLPIFEPGLDDVVKGARNKNLFFTTDLDSAIGEAEMIFVSVNTPTKKFGIGAGRAADLKNWELAARYISKVAKTSKIVIEKSTLPVRTAHSMQKVLNANPKGIKFEILSNPEFLAEGTAIRDLQNPDRVLIGGNPTELGQAAVKKLCWVYKHWIPEERVLTTNLWSSELSKLVANAFLAQRISSINSISELCETTGADVEEVSRAIGADRRIGSKFLSASVGFGGSCFQKDILNLVYLCESFGLEESARYWDQVVIMNEWQKKRFAMQMIKSMFSTISGKRIAIFGFAFKKDTGDTRETPALAVVKYLLAERAHVSIYDPQVDHAQIRRDFIEYDILPKGYDFDKYVSLETDPYTTASNAHAFAIMTEWDEFSTYDYQKIFDGMERPAFAFDGRNVLDHAKLMEIGFQVHAIGKPYHSKFNMDEES